MLRLDNSQAVTVLLFTEGKALVSLEFDSAPNDPTDPSLQRISAASKTPR